MADQSIPQTKTCPRCGLTKTADHFYVDKRNGRPQSFCKPCHRDYMRARSLSRQDKPPDFSGDRTCVDCSETKPATEFYKHRDCAGGISRRCKQCHSAYGKRRRAADAHVREYNSWLMAKSRCYNPHNEQYQDYGGRGISMCERWRDSFRAFFDDMGPRPEGTTLDRVCVDGNYEPGNCRWVDWHLQNTNKRNTVLLTVGATTMPICDWAEYSGINEGVLRFRIKSGWRPELAVSVRPGLRIHDGAIRSA